MQVGEIFDTNYGKVKVIEYFDRSKVRIEFLNTGFKTEAWTSHIRSGKVKDRLVPNVCGVGFIGDGTFSCKNNEHEYTVWNGMIARCYDAVTQAKFPTYKGCTVVKRWHNFQNFCEDIHRMPNWDTPDYQLDKDLRHFSNRKYGPNYCCFVPKDLNMFGQEMSRKALKGKNIGVFKQKSGNTYQVTLNGVYYGNFETLELANRVARKAKRKIVKDRAGVFLKKYKRVIHKDIVQNLTRLSNL